MINSASASTGADTLKLKPHLHWCFPLLRKPFYVRAIETFSFLPAGTWLPAAAVWCVAPCSAALDEDGSRFTVKRLTREWGVKGLKAKKQYSSCCETREQTRLREECDSFSWKYPFTQHIFWLPEADINILLLHCIASTFPIETVLMPFQVHCIISAVRNEKHLLQLLVLMLR